MKIISLSKNGISTPTATVFESPRGKYYCLVHGQHGRGRWQIRIPLSSKDFPVVENEIQLKGEYGLIVTDKKDARGNPLMIITKYPDPVINYLVLWKLSPGFRGSASYEVEGEAQIVAVGEEAQGDAGRMGGADCPVVLVKGPCLLKWNRSGRLYGSAASWIAEFNGKDWWVTDEDTYQLEKLLL